MTNPMDKSCPVCKARKDKPCVNIIEPGKPLPGREFHYGRTGEK